MHLLSISLENYRNIEAGSLNFKKNRIFFLGANGQGKTNLLEAIGLSASLRSFANPEWKDLFAWSKNRAVFFTNFMIMMKMNIRFCSSLGKKEKNTELDGEEIKRLQTILVNLFFFIERLSPGCDSLRKKKVA